jgi:histidine triad (HIT) family protein
MFVLPPLRLEKNAKRELSFFPAAARAAGQSPKGSKAVKPTFSLRRQLEITAHLKLAFECTRPMPATLSVRYSLVKMQNNSSYSICSSHLKQLIINLSKNPMAETTLFQKIINREIPADILMETEDAVVIRDIHPQAPVHVLIIPKKLIPRISEAQEEDMALLGKLLLTAKAFAEREQLSGGYRLVINNGRMAGETIPHLHIHLFAGRPMSWPPC